MLKRIALGVLFLVFSIIFCNAQGTIRGKIADENGETLIGVTVYMKSDPSTGTVTDIDGNYSLTVANSQPDSLIIEYVGFETIKETVSVLNIEVLIKDYTMYVPALAINEVVVVAKQERNKAYYMENIKKRSAVTLDYVSAETMKKIGDSNVTAAVTRVSGVSTNGSFITVRGIGDRYVQTTINGSQIPTLDPFTNNIKLDIIPSSLVDNVIISKTASPDLPGDWSGAYISVETKDFPEKFSVNIESQVGYNQNSSFKSILSNQKSSTDWLGYDNGFRNRTHDPNTFYTRPTDYSLFVNLGLGDFYKSLGVTRDWINLQNKEAEDTYYKLGLVELGLLSKGQINDRDAVNAAINKFNTEGLRQKAYENQFANVQATGVSFPNNWKSFQEKVTTNNTHSISTGNQFNLLGKQVGFIVGFRYGQSIQYDANPTFNRVGFSELRADSEGNLTVPTLSNYAEDAQISRLSNGWSALANLSIKLSPNNNTSFMFMPNLLGVNNLRENILFGDLKYKFQSNQFYEQRQQLVYQAKIEQFFPKSKIKFDLNASYTRGNSTVPDFKRFAFLEDENDSTQYFFNATELGDDLLFRVFRYLNENLFDSRFGVEIPISKNPSLLRKIKIGGAFKNLEKIYDQYNYEVGFGDDNSKLIVPNKDIDKFFNLSKFNFSKDINNNTLLPYIYTAQDLPPNHTQGYTSIYSGYAMSDYSIDKRFRLSGGLRVEYTDLKVDAVAYDTMNLVRNDIRRLYLGPLIANPAKQNSLNFLPSLNFIYKISQNDLAPTNLRLNYSRSIARPSLREFSESIVFDFEFRADVFGNSDLKFVDIDNYDLRFEKYFETGDNISASAFYKNFKNHIEIIQLNNGISWANTLGSFVRGLEFEGRKKIGKNFEFSSNVSLVQSKSTIINYGLTLDLATGIQTRIPLDTFSRVMFGQSPIVINSLASYNFKKIGLETSIAYNYQAPRLVIQGDRADLEDFSNNPPDVFEMPRHLVDLKLMKSLSKNFGLSLTVRDLLNSPIRRSYQLVDKSGKSLGYLADFDKFTYGTNFLLSLSYKI